MIIDIGVDPGSSVGGPSSGFGGPGDPGPPKPPPGPPPMSIMMTATIVEGFGTCLGDLGGI